MVKNIVVFTLLCYSTAAAQPDVIHNHEHAIKQHDPLQNQNYVDPKAHHLELLMLPNRIDIPYSSKIMKKKIKRLNEQRQIAFDMIVKLAMSNKLDRLLNCAVCKGSGDEVCKQCRGNGYGDCGICEGKGDQNCLNCRGSGVIRDVLLCPTCDGKGRTACGTCQGLGKKLCAFCSGIGKSNCEQCSGTGIKLVENADSLKVQSGK